MTAKTLVKKFEKWDDGYYRIFIRAEWNGTCQYVSSFGWSARQAFASAFQEARRRHNLNIGNLYERNS